MRCGSYRPISLITTELKLFAKVLVRRLEKIVGKLIHHDQTGFLKGRLASDNIRRLFHIIHASESAADPAAVFSLDVQKAFDRVGWEYLWVVLEKFGFGNKFILMVKTLYFNLCAVVQTGNVLSKPFSLQRGTRQGCPLSQLLFALSLEPLAQSIRQNPSISPICIKATVHKISLYADDILLYFTNISRSLPQILNVFTQFSQYSGYKINWDKSLLVPLNNAARQLTLPAIPHIQWHNSTFTYLGLIITQFSDISHTNYNKIKLEISSDIHRWSNLKMSLQGRVSIVKMNVLGRLNFLFSMIPVPPPAKYFDELRSLICNFIWDGKRPRIQLRTLQRPKSLGGLALPDFKLYYWSFHIKMLAAWRDEEADISWRRIEQEFVKPHRLEDVLFCGMKPKLARRMFGPIIGNSLQIWSDVQKHMGCNVTLCNHSPVWFNYSLLQGSGSYFNDKWFSGGIRTLQDMYDRNGLLSFQRLRESYSLPGFSWFLYLQLRSAIRAHGVPWDTPLPSHPLSTWVEPKTSYAGLVSNIYNHLATQNSRTLGVTEVWARDLEGQGIELDWDNIWCNIFISSKNPSHQLIHYKFVHKFYLTPYRRFKMKLIDSPNCSKCSQNTVGTYLHVFWECPPVSDFWDNVTKNLEKALKFPIPKLPSMLLLNDDSVLKDDTWLAHRKIIFAGLTAAKKTIIHSWFLTEPPSIKEWINHFRDIALIEKSLAVIHKARASSVEAWTTLIGFLSDPHSISYQ